MTCQLSLSIRLRRQQPEFISAILSSDTTSHTQESVYIDRVDGVSMTINRPSSTSMAFSSRSTGSCEDQEPPRSRTEEQHQIQLLLRSENSTYPHTIFFNLLTIFESNGIAFEFPFSEAFQGARVGETSAFALGISKKKITSSCSGTGRIIVTAV